MIIKVLQVTPQADSVELARVKYAGPGPNPKPTALFGFVDVLRCAGYRFEVLEVIPSTDKGRTFGLRLKCDLIGLSCGMLLHDADDRITNMELVSALQRVMHLVRQVAGINSLDALARWALIPGENITKLDEYLEDLGVTEDFQKLMEACEIFRKSMPPAARLRELDEAQSNANSMVGNIKVEEAVPPIGKR